MTFPAAGPFAGPVTGSAIAPIPCKETRTVKTLTKALSAAVIALACTLPAIQSASAATFKPIWRYGGKSVVMTGEIMPGDDQRLYAAVKAVYDKDGTRVERMFLNSPGGSVSAGVTLAIYVQKLGIDAVVGKTDTCASICFAIFAAAKHRAIFPTSKVGVHSVYGIDNNGNTVGSAAPGSAATTRALAKLYKSMGVPDPIIVKMMTTDGTDMAWIHGSDAAGWQLEVLN